MCVCVRDCLIGLRYEKEIKIHNPFIEFECLCFSFREALDMEQKQENTNTELLYYRMKMKFFIQLVWQNVKWEWKKHIFFFLYFYSIGRMFE